MNNSEGGFAPLATSGGDLRCALGRLETVDSTQRYAASLADSGAVDGTGVVAETQTAGRGRRGRVWKDVPGASVLMSMILRSSLPPAHLPTLAIAAGVAVAEALAPVAGNDARLK